MDSKVGMLIRKPAAQVFAAIADPAITTRFWFTKSTGKLAAGASVRWEWEMYGAHADVAVQDFKADRRILIRWGEASAPRTADFVFTPYGADRTYLQIIESGFTGSGDALTAQVASSTGGFTSMLCALKALLEHQVVLTVVADHLPPKA